VRTKLGATLRSSQVAQLVLLPSLTGVLTAAAAIAFVRLVDAVQWLALGSADFPLHVLPSVHWARILLVPLIGGLIVGPLVHFLAPETRGHGVPEVIEAFLLRGGRIRGRVAAVKSLASALTIGTGGSVGREGPIVHIGAAVGSVVAQRLHLPPEQMRTLAACGTAGGIAAVFNAPIAGAFFALEVITGNFAMPSFGPVILSSVLATVVSRAFLGNQPAFAVPTYELTSAFEILGYAGLGLMCGAVGVAFIWTLQAFERAFARSRIPAPWRPAAGGLLLGFLILAVPNLYGVGYATMSAALVGAIAWTWLALLLPAKLAATSLTLASGGSGGVFLPSLYLGAVAGGLYGFGLHALAPALTASSGAYALVGMGGVLAAATHSPITALLLLIEVTGDYRIVLPVMIAVTLATLVSRALERNSIYSLALDQRGIQLHRRGDLIMRAHSVGEVMRPASAALPEGLAIDAVVRAFLERQLVRAYVVDGNQRLIGAISIHAIQDPQLVALGPLVIAHDLAERDVHRVAPDDSLASCMEHFVLAEDDELPVVDADRRLVGVVSRRDALRIYSAELLKSDFLGVADAAAGPSRPRDPVFLEPGHTTAQVPVPPGLIGHSLRQANLRAAHRLTVVAVRARGERFEHLPDPDRPLARGDTLVVVGTAADIARFREDRAPVE
jgi:CIC family chloride channel protein